MATIHLICGPVGSGKTTHALTLARESRAVHFPIDEWMSTLFATDAPPQPDLSWALERTQRCEAQIWKICTRLLALGTDVVLDLGFFKLEHRHRFRALAREVGASVLFHYVTAEREVRRARVRSRNQNAAKALSVQVSDSIFDWAESWFEAPGEEELRGANVIRTG